MAKVIRVTQSPMNKQQWCCDLHCGHETWITSKRRPTAQNMHCSKCKAAAVINIDDLERLEGDLEDRAR